MSEDLRHLATTEGNDKPYRNVLEHLEDYDLQEGGGLPLDKGVRRYVLILRAHGVETFESCEGGEEHCFPEPTVRFHGQSGEGFRAFGIARTYALPVSALRRYYSVEDGELVGPQWEMTFTRRADSV